MRRRGKRERIYDEQIAPLMDEIIRICRENNIPIAATFQLTKGDDPLVCSTAIVPEWADNDVQSIAYLLRLRASGR